MSSLASRKIAYQVERAVGIAESEPVAGDYLEDKYGLLDRLHRVERGLSLSDDDDAIDAALQHPPKDARYAAAVHKELAVYANKIVNRPNLRACAAFVGGFVAGGPYAKSNASRLEGLFTAIRQGLCIDEIEGHALAYLEVAFCLSRMLPPTSPYSEDWRLEALIAWEGFSRHGKHDFCRLMLRMAEQASRYPQGEALLVQALGVSTGAVEAEATDPKSDAAIVVRDLSWLVGFQMNLALHMPNGSVMERALLDGFCRAWDALKLKDQRQLPGILTPLVGAHIADSCSGMPTNKAASAMLREKEQELKALIGYRPHRLAVIPPSKLDGLWLS